MRSCSTGVHCLAPCGYHQLQICPGADRKTHAECRSLRLLIVGAENLAFMLAHDAITDAQAQPGSLPHFLGGKKRIKDALRMLDAFAVIAEKDLNPAAILNGFDLNQAGSPGGLHGVISVVQDIEKHLLQLMRIANQLQAGAHQISRRSARRDWQSHKSAMRWSCAECY